MSNNVIIDIAIGLIFIFLIYSLLATSFQEAIATAFSLRAMTLKNGIVNRMLCNTPEYSGWESVRRQLLELLRRLYYFFRPGQQQKSGPVKLGNLFYDHPLIKNYGSSRVFPYPSYFPANSFSRVMVDILNDEFMRKRPAINAAQPGALQQGMPLNPPDDITQLKALLAYYGSYYTIGSVPPSPVIEKDTWQILQMQLSSSGTDIQAFKQELETWFNDTMDRVSGWYKRQVQFILFVIGLAVAITFNVDVIAIAGRLSMDKATRDQLVRIAIREAGNDKGNIAILSAAARPAKTDSLTVRRSRHELAVAQDTLLNQVGNVNNFLALGWNYGNQSGFIQRTIFVLTETFTDASRLLGFLILAFAVCLGAPFWFDLLNKAVNIRGSGKQAGTGDTPANDGS